MKVVILTRDDPHHKHLCVRIARRHRVVGIVHPAAGATKGRLRRVRNWAKMSGWPLALLSASAAAPEALSGWMMKNKLVNTGKLYYGAFAAEYDTLDPKLIHRGVDVRSAAARELIGRLGPDIVVALGGPVYPAQFIAACPLVLNFHSGISPIYNGSSTISFAFANGHPHLCGGTLMKMNTAVDGGAILAHYLPSIEADDDPASLFMKTVGGAATLYERVLDSYAAGQPLRSIPQPPPLFYYRYANWSLYQSQRTAYHVKTKLAAKHLRPTQIVQYWDAPSDEEAQARYRGTIDQLLWGSAP